MMKEEEKKKKGEEEKKREEEEEMKKKGKEKKEKGKEKIEEEKKKEEEEKKKKEEEEKKKEEGKEEKEKLSGSNEAVEAVDRAIELDEKIQERRLTLLNMAVQDMKMMDICEKDGINPRDTFRGYVTDKEGVNRLKVVTVGEEGEKRAKDMIKTLGNSNEWHVKSESVSRVEWDDLGRKESDDDPLIRPMKGVRQRIRKRLAKFE